MANRLNNQEEKFKEILENLDFEVNTEQLWKNIEDRVDKPRRRLPFVWLLLGILMISIPGAFWYSNYTELHELRSAVAQQELNNTSPETPLDLETKTHSQSTVEENSTATEKLKNRTNSNTHHAAISTNEQNVNNSIQTKTSKQKRQASIDPNNTNNTTKKERTETNNRELNQGKDLARKDIGLPLENENKNAKRIDIKWLNKGIFTWIALPFRELLDKVSLTPVAPKNEEENRPKPLFVAASTGANGLLANYTETSPSFTEIQEREKGQVGLNAMLGIGKSIGDKTRISLGAYYQKSIASYTYSDLQSETRTIEVVNTSYDIEGNAVEQSTEAEETIINEYDINWHRKHEEAGVYLDIAQDIISTSTINFGLSVRYNQGLWLSHSGYYLNTNEEKGLTKIGSGAEDNPYKKGLNSSVMLGLHLEKNWDRVTVGLYPKYQLGLQSVIDTESLSSLRHQHINVNVGLRYILEKK